MAGISERETSPYSPRQLFQLVADVASYQDFLPWCAGSRIVAGEAGEVWREGGQQLAELTIQFKPFRESYVSRVTFYPPAEEHSPCRVLAELERGLFRHLTTQWELTPLADGGCQIDFSLDFHFRSALLQKLMGSMFQLAMQKMAQAFHHRAERMYGRPS